VVFDNKTELAIPLLENKVQFDAEHLQTTISSIHISVKAASESLSDIDTTQPNARKQAEHIIQQMFRNSAVYNAWLAYEPNAFDNNDAGDLGGYPGAPSGRFIRSYAQQNGKLTVMPDMDEQTINDPRKTWYSKAIKTGKLHIDINENPLYDYQDHNGPINVYSVGIPLWRDGQIIGVVGADGKIDSLFSALDEKTGVVAMLFSDDLRITGAKNTSLIGKRLEDTGLLSYPHVREKLREKQVFLLKNVDFSLLDNNVIMAFNPVKLDIFGETVWIVAALSMSSIYKSLYLIIVVILISMIAFALFFFFSLRYVARMVSSPVQDMTRIANALCLDDTQFKDLSSHRQDSGHMMVSFYQMLDVLKTRLETMRWQQEMLDLHLFLEKTLGPDCDPVDFFRHAAHRFVRVLQTKRLLLRLYGITNDGATERQVTKQVAFDAIAGFGAKHGEAPSWHTCLHDSLLAPGNQDAVWQHNADDGEGGKITICALPLHTATKGLFGSIFLVFDNLPLGDIEQHIEFIAQEITHSLSGQEMRLDKRAD
jgi:hypothetical protein